MTRLMLPMLAALALVLAACDTSPPPPPGPLAGTTYHVGSKEFDEQRIFCQLEIARLRGAGAGVVDDCGIVGTDTARNALLSGRIDTYVEYTATGWVDDLRRQAYTRDPLRQFTDVRDNDVPEVVWTDPALRMNTTYAIAVDSRRAQELGGIRTLSEFARYANENPTRATLCVEQEFNGRPDGLDGLLRTYGISEAFNRSGAVTVLDVGEPYEAIRRGKPCTFGEVYSSDGRIGRDRLTLLVDDKAYFPLYTPAVVVRREAHTPAFDAVMAPVMNDLTDADMADMCEQVSIGGRDPVDVAVNWLRTHGL